MKIFLYITAMIGFTVIANLLMKTGAVMSGENSNIWVRFINWRIICGFLSFGLGAIIYIILLRQLPLNIAQSFAAAQFVAVILASSFVLSEPIGSIQWLGIMFISLGIAIVGWSQG